MQTYINSNENADPHNHAKFRLASDARVPALGAPEKPAHVDGVIQSRITHLEGVIASAMGELADLRLQRRRRIGATRSI